MEQTFAPLVTNKPQDFRPRGFMAPSRTADDVARTEQLRKDHHERNGIHKREKLHRRKSLDMNGPAVEIDEELEEEWGVKRDPNRPLKSELARMRRIIDRGDTLSPSEMDAISDIPEAQDLVRINQERIEPKGGFTLSPAKLLLRSL